VLALLASALAACGSGGDGPSATVDRYVRAWNRGDYEAMAKLVVKPPADFVDFHRGLVEQLHLSREEHRAAEVREDGDRARVVLSHQYTTDPFGAWETRGTLELVKRDDE